MKCIKCGSELTEGSRFCSYCGAPIENTTVESVQDEERNETVVEVSQEEPKDSNENKCENKLQGLWRRVCFFDKVSIIAIVMFAILGVVAYLFKNTLAVVVSVIQIALWIIAVLMKKQIIKGKKGLYVGAMVVALLLIFPYINSYRVDYGNAEEFEWNEIVLHDAIPQPDSLFGEITYNFEDGLSLYIYKTTAKQYTEYVNACKEKGFTVDVEQYGYSFFAYNGFEYALDLDYDTDRERMYIDLEVLEQYGTLTWPEDDVFKMLPIPKSKTGKVEEDEEVLLKAYVAQTTIEEYKNYVELCFKNGFNVDVDDSEQSYVAKNNDSYKLEVEYEGNNVISITLYEPQYNVDIEIECAENLIFNTYDVKMYIDDSYETTITHGDTESCNIDLEKGKHTIKFVSQDDDDVTGKVQVEIEKDQSYKFKISCGLEKITVKTISGKTVTSKEKDTTNSNASNKDDKEKVQLQENQTRPPEAATYLEDDNYKDVVDSMTKAGFTNIQTEVIYDLGTGMWDSFDIDTVESVSIDGKKDFDEEDIFNKDALVIISYHALEKDNPNIQYVPYSVGQLLDEVESNPMRAEEKHYEEYVEVTGKISDIDRNGNYILMCATNDILGLDYIYCGTITEEQEKHLVNLSKGDVITIRGKITVVDIIYPYSIDIFSFK